MDKGISHLRKDYVAGILDEGNISPNPIDQFKKWFNAALESTIIEPNAMVLSTAFNHQPSSRVVLLKGFDDNGFVFFTNYDSRKGHELEKNPLASLLFFWDKMERQVRIEGRVEKVSAEVSTEYFNSRPFGSRIGALASPQSHKIPDRESLEKQVEALQQQYKGNNDQILRPDNWGGYILRPHTFEFWQGRSSRLHDRILYERQENDWSISRLAP